MIPVDPKERLAFWNKKAEHYVEKARANGGKYKRSDGWYHEYCDTPYLTFASGEYLQRRFIDQFHNNVRLTASGQIAPRMDFAEDDGLFAPLFSHLWLEYEARGGTPTDAIVKARGELDRYFHVRPPRGARLFKDYPETLENVVVKFGKRKHMENMLTKGELRITPSGFYSQGSLLKAMQDLETQREFHLPAFNEVLEGKSTISIKGVNGQVVDGFVKLVVECPDYMLWCACQDIDRRLPEDFGADAALIIRNVSAFVQRLSGVVRSIWPKSKIWSGAVGYYDPCSHVHLKRRPETIKHFSFAYQREWRTCIFPPEDQLPNEPVLLALGSLADIAELVVMPQ